MVANNFLRSLFSFQIFYHQALWQNVWKLNKKLREQNTSNIYHPSYTYFASFLIFKII